MCNASFWNYLEFYYITQCVFKSLLKRSSTRTLRYMFRPIFVIRCLKLKMKTLVLSFCDSNIRRAVPPTPSCICNILSVYLFPTHVNIPNDDLYMYLLHGALCLFLLCCVSRVSRESRRSRLRVFAKLDWLCFLYCVCVAICCLILTTFRILCYRHQYMRHSCANCFHLSYGISTMYFPYLICDSNTPSYCYFN
jgi:hypothetical protein